VKLTVIVELPDGIAVVLVVQVALPEPLAAAVHKVVGLFDATVSVKSRLPAGIGAVLPT
jgi:hypothetical protein